MSVPADVPDVLPLLARGKHRSPRRGACFMELVSYLAGERWSDHPACTHRLLAHLARLVNDLTDDAARPRLALLIPAVIGLHSTDPQWDDELTLLAASRTVPVVSEHRQRALAVGALACERARAQRAGAEVTELHPATRRIFEQAPLAAAWAREFTDSMRPVRPAGAVHPGEAVLEIAAVGLAEACVADPAAELRHLLSDAITLCQQLAGRPADTSGLASDTWREVCVPVPAPTG